MTTAAELIALALHDAGVVGKGQTADAEDTNNALLRLNYMVSQWRRKRWLVYRLINTAFTSTGAQSYTVGTGGNYDINRPDKIESAFVRILNPGGTQTDTPLDILGARQDYDRIRAKTIGTYPICVFYDPAYPLGVLYPWPVPAAGLYAVHITTKIAIEHFSDLTEEIELPPEYMAALHYNLVKILRAAYRMPPRADLELLAKDALEVVRGANSAVPRLTMPAGLTGFNGGYNILNDQGR